MISSGDLLDFPATIVSVLQVDILKCPKLAGISDNFSIHRQGSNFYL